VVQLGRLAGWDPLPLSVRDARRVAGPLRDRLAGTSPRQYRPVPGSTADGLEVSSLVVQYGATVALRGVDLAVAPGEVVALMGRNGSGKSSLLWAVQGAGRRSGGAVRVAGSDPARMSRTAAARLVALVPQQGSDLLYHQDVDAECAAADRASSARPGSTRARFDRLVDGATIAGHTHPRDLSDGQRLGLALAVQLAAEPKVLLLDEPTRGLDYTAKERLTASLASLAAGGRAVVVATHDVEFVASTASRVVVLAEGEVVTSAPTQQALAGSPVFASQVAKVLSPQPWLSVGQVAEALSSQVTQRG
jgi:energy-coupling factor transport system ATP-binding protein